MSIATANGEEKKPETEPKKQALAVVHDDSQFAGLMDSARFSQAWRVAQLFADSTIVPQHFQKNPANCFIGIHMAMRCGVDPLMFLQKCYVVHGRPGIESTLAIALANSSGVFASRISYELKGEGESRACTASATVKATGEIVEETVSVGIAKKMGWWQKDGSLWPKMTDLMLKYRAAMWLIRTNAPEVIMGLLSKDELMDAEPGDGPPARLGSKIGPSRLSEMLSRPEDQQLAAQLEASEMVVEDETQRQPGEDDDLDRALALEEQARDAGCPEDKLPAIVKAALGEPDPAAFIGRQPWRAAERGKGKKELFEKSQNAGQ